MTHKIIFDEICELVREHFPKVQKVGLLTKIREEIAPDSLAQLTLVVELENKFALTLAEDFAQDILTVDDLVRALYLEIKQP